MNSPIPHSPEAMLVAAHAELKALQAEKARLQSELAAAKGEISTTRSGPVAPMKPSVKYAGAHVHTQGQRDELYLEMMTVPQNEQRSFYLQHIRGKMVV